LRRAGGSTRRGTALQNIKSSVERFWRSTARIPFTRWRIGVGLLCVLIFAALALAYAGFRHSNNPIFCTSCHEMRVHYDTWRISSHKDVPCEDCHIMPGLGNMVKAKVAALREVYVHVKGRVSPAAIRGRVPDVSCKRCHLETRETVVYHGLKITHRKHWDRGIGCTFCHSRVVHGRSAATKNTPSMGVCYKCHDGKRAPNNCSLCHETLGVRRVTTFSPEWVEGHKEEARNPKLCVRCHQKDFCDTCHRMATPHSSDWLPSHPKEFKKDPARCAVCHPKATQEMFCGECHKIRRAHAMDWIAKHSLAFRKNSAACDRCHQKSFCSDCHQRYKSHPADWLQRHPGEAKSKPENCKVCHAERFCVGCHTNKTPQSHSSPTWLEGHSQAANSSSGACAACHKPDFCMQCHKTRRPNSHKVNWGRLHSIDAARNPAACNTCHPKQSCSQCHGIQMPHPSKWVSAHQAAAKRNKKLCDRCHKPSYCVACHRGTLPKSHTDDWTSTHGRIADKPNANCSNCHSKTLCAACHKNARPSSHVSTWPTTHGKVAKNDAAPCAKCHNKAKFCDACHGTPMPHADGWMGQHKDKGASLAEGSLCFKCHKREYCQMCHPAQ